MGTNYYWHPHPLAAPIHIGKSSAGWCFGLCVHPDLGIADLPDWERHWIHGWIEDEYGDIVSVDEMRERITARSWERNRHLDDPVFLRWNHAVPGPNGLLRHAVGDYCVGHGAGTWDLLPPGFS